MSGIHVIAITGGPCAGKSTGMAYLRQKLEELGCVVITTPESPTDLILRGITPKRVPLVYFQQEVGERMLYDLEQAKRCAKEYRRKHSKRRVVILCDRGIGDILAYTPPGAYKKLLRVWRLGSHQEMKQNLYDCVIHMVTAANGAEKYYTLSNNAARLEGTIKAARAVDRATQKAWIGHPHFSVVDNSKPFEEKLQRVLRHICNSIGLPEPMEFEKKFLVSSWKRRGLSAIGPRVDVDIVQAYTSQRGERIRRRRVERVDSYFHTVKYPGPKGGNVEYERLIGEDEFDGFVGRYGLSERFLAKRRHSFVANGRHFELDVFEEGGLVLLECELPSMDEVPVVPYFIKVEREVTDDPYYSNYQIWKRQFA